MEKQKQNVQIVTDSAADIPEELVKEYNLTVVPLSILFGEKEYKDKVNLSSAEFWQKMRVSPTLPATNQVNPHEFVEAFQPHLAENKSILYIGISLKLSGTMQSAQLAKDILKTDRIHTFNTCSASLGEGIFVLRAAEMLKAGFSLQEILAELERQQKQAFGYIVLDSLKHLVKGGRLSMTQSVVGSILNIKPLLSFTQSGEVVVAEKVRSLRKALSTIIERAKESRSDFNNTTVAIAHTDASELAAEFSVMVRDELKPKSIVTGLVGPTVGTHAGPGGVALFY